MVNRNRTRCTLILGSLKKRPEYGKFTLATFPANALSNRSRQKGSNSTWPVELVLPVKRSRNSQQPEIWPERAKLATLHVI